MPFGELSEIFNPSLTKIRKVRKNNKKSVRMSISASKLESSLTYLAHAIDCREDGEKYYPLFERLEAELKFLEAQTDTRSRVQALARKKSF